MYRTQKILLHPTESQRRLFAGSCGLSRFAWNWALALCQRHYEWYGKLPGYKRLTAFSLQKRWNKVKDRHFPWVRGYSKHVAEDSFKKLDLAYKAAFSRLKKSQPPGFPGFRAKRVHESFRIVPCHQFPVRVKGKRFNIPRIGFVKSQTKLRWPDGKQVYGTVKHRAGRWWLSMAYELPNPEKLPEDRPTCGIDLGCTTFATIASKGVIVDEVKPPKPYAKAKRRLKRLSRVLGRKTKGSKNRVKSVKRLARVHERVANIRDNFLHQFTSRLTKRYGVIVLENLSVQGIAGGLLAGTIHDLGFGEFRRQVEYKAEATGTQVVFADRFYPSSKMCSACDRVKAKLGLKERMWTCECGVTHNRDHNAALNLEKLGTGSAESTPVEIGVPAKRKPSRSRSKKQEFPIG